MSSVSIQNLSRPGNTDFYSGERWAIVIVGATAAKAVSNTATANGVPLGTTTYGTTDANGYFLMIGTMGLEDTALWTEIWKVDGVQVLPTLQFRVRPARPTPSEAPFEIPEGLWLYGVANLPMPVGIFISDDATVTAAAMNLTLGSVAVESWASPWNIMSSAVGSMLPSRRRVYAY